MINKANILKMVHAVARRRSGLRAAYLLHPRREWVIGLGLFVLVTGAGVWHSIATFQQHQTTEADLSTQPPKVLRYNNAAAETVVANYEARRARLTAVEQFTAPVAEVATSSDKTTATSSESERIEAVSETAGATENDSEASVMLTE